MLEEVNACIDKKEAPGSLDRAIELLTQRNREHPVTDILRGKPRARHRTNCTSSRASLLLSWNTTRNAWAPAVVFVHGRPIGFVPLGR